MARRQALLVSYHYPPARAVGARRAARIARLLPAHGYDVDVVCSHDDEDADADHASYVGSHGERVLAIPTPFVFGRNPGRPAPEGGFARAWWKLRAYVEYLFLTADWSWRWGKAALRVFERAWGKKRYDVVIVDAPPRSAVAPFVFWAVEHGVPVVVDLRDVWAFEVEEPSFWWPLHPETRRIRWGIRLRNRVLGLAEHIVMNTPEMMRLMQERLGESSGSRFSAIPNAFREVDERPTPRDASREFTIAYTGSLAYGRLELAANLVQAIARLRERGHIVRLVLASDAVEPLAELASETGTEDLVTLHQWMEREAVVALQRRSDALLLLQPDSLACHTATPAKLFEYMERRKHVLGLVAPGPAARIIADHRLGEVDVGTDPHRIAEAVLRLMSLVERTPVPPDPPPEYSEEATMAVLARILDDVLDGEADNESR